MNLCDYSEVTRLLNSHGFKFSKSMGQNFLIDPEVPERIADSAGLDSSCGVLEIGPGIGALTVQLCKRAGSVVAVELDNRLIPVLKDTLSEYDNVSVLSGDIMKMDVSALIAEKFAGKRVRVCANLPYNITTPVLTKLIETPGIDSITVMVQREVARRICGAAATPDYGAFSVFVQYHSETEFLFEVPPESFVPRPKVHSAVITISPKDKYPLDGEAQRMFFRVTRAAFAQRRKTLLNALSAAFGDKLKKDEVLEAIRLAGIDPQARGETLDVEHFCDLACQIMLIFHQSS